jgi:hypothetical protein
MDGELGSEENSLHHGVKKKTNPGSGTLILWAFLKI